MLRSTKASSRWFGIVISVSTWSRSSREARSAWRMRFLPSNSKGLVTTATASAPASAASLARMGPAPEPVPPPSPIARKIMSAPATAAASFSWSSSAAFLPTSGSAPAPRPLVRREPICSLFGAAHLRSAWRSVLQAKYSTPFTPAAIMRLTAFEPPPPTPITRIVAGEASPRPARSRVSGPRRP